LGIKIISWIPNQHSSSFFVGVEGRGARRVSEREMNRRGDITESIISEGERNTTGGKI
jgi:hypothetical protein